MYEGEERRKLNRLSEEEIERISDRAVEKITAQVGKTSLKGIAWFLGILITAFLTWLFGSNHINFK